MEVYTNRPVKITQQEAYNLVVQPHIIFFAVAVAPNVWPGLHLTGRELRQARKYAQEMGLTGVAVPIDNEVWETIPSNTDMYSITFYLDKND